MYKYFPHTEEDLKAMLEKVGVRSLDDLYAQIPESIRYKDDYRIPSEMSELEVRQLFDSLGSQNHQLTCFAGYGVYDHYTPSVIPNLLSRSEFLTSYTPYQAEISQGTLHYIFEYQSMMAELTGMDISNASMYDGSTATAEAMMMAVAAGKKANRVLVSETLNADVRKVLDTYALHQGIELVTIAMEDGVTSRHNLEALLAEGGVAGVIVQQPNAYGIIEDFTGFADACHENKALLVINSIAADLALLKTPGEWGADIAVGDGQSLGIPMQFGGPYVGYMCCTEKLIRKMPGRIVGMTKDNRGQRAFVLTLQAREQHIRRQKATSNICSNQSLMALWVTVYMSLMGKQGLKEAAQLGYAGAHYMCDELLKSGRFSLAYDKPFFNEFLVKYDGDVDMLYQRMLDAGFLGGVRVKDGLLFAVTEKRTKEDSCPMNNKLYGNLIFELSREGRKGYSLPKNHYGNYVIPQELCRQEDAALPECDEPTVVRHYTNLSNNNFGVDNGFYPLGSCTMKYNPKINEEMAAEPHFQNLHPKQPVQTTQGALAMVTLLERALCELTGLAHFTFKPYAGAHGELTGLMTIDNYHRSRGDLQRKKVIVPDSAHGTNPASAAVCGLEIVEVKSDARGLVDFEDLERLVEQEGPNIAAMMMTNPNTLGLFEERIPEIARLIHDCGALMYYDGANLNPMLGACRPGDMGFDVMHINLHKTFSTPHGGGGPGAGPVGVREGLQEFFPFVSPYHGNFAVMMRAYAYILSLGREHVKEVGPLATLNANYIKESLKDVYELPIDGLCCHEFVFDGLKDKSTGVTTMDVAKRLLDYGYHAPTIYFPLLFHESLMVEPTESESKETLDGFIEVMRKIAGEAKTEPDTVKSAPHLTPIGRVDDVLAAKHPVVTFSQMSNEE